MHVQGELHRIHRGVRKATDPSHLPSDAEETFRRLLARYMTQSALSGSDLANLWLGTRALMGEDFLPPSVARFLEDYTGTFAREWVQERADSIAAAIREGVTAGENMTDIAARVGGVFDGEMADANALMIARTETIRASNAGALGTYAQAGVEQKEWSATEGEGTCDECDMLDGEQSDLSGNFPGGYDAPPAHPNCRCALLPVLPEFGAAGGATDGEGDAHPPVPGMADIGSVLDAEA